MSNKLVLLFKLVFLLAINIKTHSQNTGPASPEFSSFEPVDAADMVNLATGDFVYTLPIISIPGPEGGYPLALSNHSGVTMDMEASWVGLGWTLNAGAINRNVVSVPDDSKEYVTTTIGYQPEQNDIYHEVSLSYGFGDGIASIGVSVGWYQFSSMGGGVTIGMTAGMGPTDLGVGSEGTASIGFDPTYFLTQNANEGSIGHIMNKAKLGTNSGISIGDHGVGLSGSLSSNYGFSLGVSYDTKGGGIRPSGGTSYVSSSEFHSPGFSASSFSIYIPLQLLQPYLPNIGYSRTKMKTWLFDETNISNYGSIYASEACVLENWDQNDTISFDSYIVPYSKDNHTKANSIEQSNCLSFPGYDNYSVVSQGLAGSISPRIYEWGTLARQKFVDKRSEFGETEFMNYFIQKPFTVAKIHYYFDNEIVSYLDVDQVAFNWNSGSGISPDGYFQGISRPVFDNTNNEGSSYFANNRRGGATHVEYFTNGEIVDAYSSDGGFTYADDIIQRGFLEVSDIIGTRNSHNLFDEDGIGAFSITSADGKTYHYSLPVYQFEQFTSTEEITDVTRSLKKFVEKRKLDKYAYTWLLTAVTGPDYVDRGDIGVIDSEDYGYWVKFDYGKWSDAYIWRYPYSDYDNIEDGWGSYSWGRKQVYYLDAIQTRTHTAIFIKEDREDALGALTSNVFNSEVYTVKPRLDEDDCANWEIFCRIQRGINPVFNGETVKQIYSNYEIYNIDQHRSLRLKKIILIDNSKLEKLSKSNQSKHPRTNSLNGPKGSMHIYEEKWTGDKDSHSSFIYRGRFNEYNSNTYYGEKYNSVYDISDLEDSDLASEDILKSVTFDYDYSLCNNTPNAKDGKLTLKSLQFLGRREVAHLPPYLFEYASNPNYNNDYTDSWGYYKEIPEAWCLSNIHTPTGGEIAINYEPDSYSREAVFGNGVRYNIEIDDDIFISQNSDRITIEVNIPEKINMEQIDPLINNFEISCKLEGKKYYCVSVVPQETNLDSFFYSKEIITRELEYISKDISTRTMRFYISWPNTTISCSDSTSMEEKFSSCIDNTFIIYGLDMELIGGGVRVSSIELKKDGIMEKKTGYSYDSDGKTTGTTSYAPWVKDKAYIPYVSEIPSPAVMYGKVATTNYSSTGEKGSSVEYNFHTLEAANNSNDAFRIGDVFYVEEKQDEVGMGTFEETGTYYLGEQTADLINTNDNRRKNYLRARSAIIHDYLSSLGRLESIITYNSFNDVTSSQYYEYYDKNEIEIGITKESFVETKAYGKFNDNRNFLQNYYYFTTSSRKIYPNIAKRLTSITQAGENATIYGDATIENYGFDIETGACQYVKSVLPSGDNIISRSIPAYTIPAYKGDGINVGMGPKFYNPLNKNMLSQSAATLVTKNDKPISISIETWKSDWDNYLEWNSARGLLEVSSEPQTDVWRKHKAFVWNGDLNADGTYGSDFNAYASINNLRNNWNTYFGEDNYDKWLKISEIERYDHFSTPIEVSDINGDYTATKKDPNNKFIIASAANAKHSQFAHCGFEYVGYPSHDNHGACGTFIEDPYYDIVSTKHYETHTGKKCMRLYGSNPNGSGIEYRIDASEVETFEDKVTFIVSIWVYNVGAGIPESIFNCIIDGPGTATDPDAFRAGNWIQLSRIFTVNTNPATDLVFSVTTYPGLAFFIDDFRVAPYESAVNAYIYDDYGKLTAILNNNNFATKYEYDDAGRLTATYVEKPTGFEKVSEHEYNYSGYLYVSPNKVENIPLDGINEIRINVYGAINGYDIALPNGVNLITKEPGYFTINVTNCGVPYNSNISVSAEGEETVVIPISQNLIEVSSIIGTQKTGYDLDLNWDACPSQVDIDLFTSDGAYVSGIASNHSNQTIGNTLSWEIPTDLCAGDLCSDKMFKVRISSSSNGYVYAETNNFLIIDMGTP